MIVRVITISATLLSCGSVTVLAQAARTVPAPQNELGSADWSAKGSRSLTNSTPSDKAIETFVRSVEIYLTGESSLGEAEAICSHRFADLRHDHYLSLVCGQGVRDRPECGDVYIIDRAESGFEMYSGSGDSYAGRNVAANIKDLRHDGRLEFLLSDDLGSIPQRCIASWSIVYAWTGANYTNVSADFRDFYQERLREIDKIIPTLGTYRGVNGYGLADKECLEAEKAAIQRFLGISSDAGINQAIRLASSEDNAEREFATELLNYIGTARARVYLSRLAKDKDPGVAIYAKSALTSPVRTHPVFGGADFTPVN